MSKYNIFETSPNTFYIGRRPGQYVYNKPCHTQSDALRRVYALYYVEGIQMDFNDTIYQIYKSNKVYT